MSVLPLEPQDPRRLGRFRITARLGEGGQGIVYLGVDPANGDQQVAVKVLKTASDPEARKRLKKEMAAAQQVDEFCTAQVLDGSVDGPQPFVVSEYVEGPSLYDRVQDRGPLTGGRLYRLAVGTATALTAIHAAGVVHRDLKPSNVLLGPDGPVVVDFGIARQADSDTITGQLIGTPSYMAPEQLDGKPASRASDVFAWAGTMVFAATGRTPFGHGQNLSSIIAAIVTREPDLTGVPDKLLTVIRTCLDKDPANRPTARALLDRLLDPSVGLGQEEAVAQVAQAAQNALNLPGAGRDVTQVPQESDPPVPVPDSAPPDQPVDQDRLPYAPPVGAFPYQQEPAPSYPPVSVPPPAPPPGPQVPWNQGLLRPQGVDQLDETRPPRRPDERQERQERQEGAEGGSRWGVMLMVLTLLVAAGIGGWYFFGKGGGAGGGGTGDGVPAAYAGTWTGQVTGGAINRSSQNVKIVLTKGSSAGTFSTGACTGDLNFSSDTGSGINLNLAGETQCPTGTVTLQSNADGTLAYRLAGSGETYSGTLRKS
ncbi:serine/threonine-protein kinase [Actinomadura scrupuli]|uniref:serine/threonine-protein kinase n=1 Tax=Actinomadura scrupuli TaxID=559629 RepID=UPI003D972DB1